MNNITLVGRLSKNPELRYVGSEQNAVADFTLAVDRKFRSKEGTKKTDFIRIELWGKQAEICSQYLTKGRLIGVEGELRVENYQTTTGENRSISKVRAYRFTFLESKGRLEESSDNSTEKYYNGKELFEKSGIDTDIDDDIDDDNLPF